jgi:hypothetical protein
LALVAGCAQEPPPSADDVLADLRAQFSESEDPAEKLELARSFITRFPEHEQAPMVLDAAVGVLTDDMDDAAGALALVDQTLAEVSDPEIRFSMRTSQWRLAREHGEPFSLAEVAAELDGHREPKYTELYELMELAVDAEEWALAESWADTALTQASPEAYRADYPGREFSDEVVAQRAANRRTFALGHKAWAAYQQGRTEEAMALFAEGADDMNFTYVGAPETPLHTYWGRAAFEQGDLDRAAELVEADAVMGGSEFAMDTLRQVHVARTGSEEGFEAYLTAARQRLARTVDDVTLSHYSGAEFQLASTRDKVVLLSFWFPT